MSNSSVIRRVAGNAFVLPGDDIDTDRIIPARFLKCVTFEGLGEFAFMDDRQQMGGEHPFDLKINAGKSILVAGANFGSGSSREHAVHALTRSGIAAIIAPSFSEIFSGNAGGNGLVCVRVSNVDHARIVELIGQGIDGIEIDIECNRILVGRDNIPFECSLPEATREAFLKGTWDSMAVCLEAGDLIEKCAAQLPSFKIRLDAAA